MRELAKRLGRTDYWVELIGVSLCLIAAVLSVVLGLDRAQAGWVFGLFGAVVLAFGLMLGPIWRKLQHLPSAAVVEAYNEALECAPAMDHSLRFATESLWRHLEPTFRRIASAKVVEDKAFFTELGARVEPLEQGDRILAVCGKKFWNDRSETAVARYWARNMAKAARRVLVMRVFVADEPIGDSRDFSPEIEDALDLHRAWRCQLRSWHGAESSAVDLSGQLKLRRIDRSLREALTFELKLDARFGFALISRRRQKTVSFHRLVGSGSLGEQHLKGSVIKEEALVYAIYEELFWELWKNAERVGDEGISTEPWPLEGLCERFKHCKDSLEEALMWMLTPHPELARQGQPKRRPVDAMREGESGEVLALASATRES